MDYIANNLLGKDSNDFVSKYLNGDQLLPLWNTIANKNESDKSTVNRLNEYEFELYTWFQLENQLYQYDITNQSDLMKLAQEADKEEVQFSDKVTEETVKNASPTIYNMLKEYALRAKVCSINYNDISLREKLLTSQSNLDKWDAFKKNLK